MSLKLMQQIEPNLISGIQLNLVEMVGKGIVTINIYYKVTNFTGQFGVVYRGTLIRNNIPQPVAIKTIKSELYVSTR